MFWWLPDLDDEDNEDEEDDDEGDIQKAKTKRGAMARPLRGLRNKQLTDKKLMKRREGKLKDRRAKKKSDDKIREKEESEDPSDAKEEEQEETEELGLKNKQPEESKVKKKIPKAWICCSTEDLIYQCCSIDILFNSILLQLKSLLLNKKQFCLFLSSATFLIFKNLWKHGQGHFPHRV